MAPRLLVWPTTLEYGVLGVPHDPFSLFLPLRCHGVKAISGFTVHIGLDDLLDLVFRTGVSDGRSLILRGEAVRRTIPYYTVDTIGLLQDNMAL